MLPKEIDNTVKVLPFMDSVMIVAHKDKPRAISGEWKFIITSELSREGFRPMFIETEDELQKIKGMDVLLYPNRRV